MKSRYLLLLPLLLVGCSAKIENKANYSEPQEEHYFNVYYEYVAKERYYLVGYIEEDNERYWNVSLKDTFHLFFDEYQIGENNERIYNEFYVKGNSSLLILYHYFK